MKIRSILKSGFCPLFFLLISVTAVAQQAAVAEAFRDIAGTPFFPKTYVDVNGTPYLFEDWETSNIVLHNGQVLKDVKTNFNLTTNQLLYLDEKGATMAASPTVIKLVETKTRKFVTTPAKNAYAEVLSSQGKATLLRLHKKVIMETKAFNSATVQKNFVTNESHVLLVNENVTEVKSSNDLFEVLAPAEGLKEFAKKEKLKPRSPNSWVKIVDFFNSI